MDRKIMALEVVQTMDLSRAIDINQRRVLPL